MRALIALLAAPLLFGLAPAADKFLSFSNIQIPTPAGGIIATDLAARKGSRLTPTRLTGTIQNSTNKNWSLLMIKITPVDGAGTQFRGSTIELRSVPPGGSKTFYFDITGKFDFPSVSYTFEYVNGSYAAAYHFEMTKPAHGGLQYSDEITEWAFAPATKQIGFALFNKSEKILKLDWNSATLVDQNGKTHRLAGSGIRYMEINAMRPPTTIPPGARVNDALTPTDKVWYATTGWAIDDLFPECPACLEWTDRPFSLLLPIELGDVKREYLFQFRVTFPDSPSRAAAPVTAPATLPPPPPVDPVYPNVITVKPSAPRQ